MFAAAVKAMGSDGQGQPAICEAELTVIARGIRGGTCRNVWRSDQASHAIFRAGPKAGVWKKILKCWRPMRTTRRDDRQHTYAHISTARRSKKDGEDQAIGRSKGGSSTKIHAMAMPLGNPAGFLPDCRASS